MDSNRAAADPGCCYIYNPGKPPQQVLTLRFYMRNGYLLVIMNSGTFNGSAEHSKLE
ncbi:hypothetical protein I79_002678 [Cricetulus griseus]|uniref:Uncharacterized protein n=1 Tax=Cricetulus griseus TaxID=10029 RepID=G3GY23_CRIGR|nr:hypothetical protein I79_002678 [Cricetulus griseus]